MEEKKLTQQNKNLHKMVRNVLAKFCDECGTSYEDDDLKIIQKNKKGIMVHLSCKNCGKTHLATIIKPLGITNRMPIKTDLRASEINRFAGKESVGANDLLDVYEWCKKATEGDSGNCIKDLTK